LIIKDDKGKKESIASTQREDIDETANKYVKID